MILTINNKTVTIGDRVLYKESNKDIVLDLQVRGSYFPPRNSATSSCTFEIVGQVNVDCIVYFNFNDGTGEHAYPLKNFVGNRRLRWDLNGSTTNPATLYLTGVYNYAPYYYQDLPAGVINTVNDNYGDLRTITIRFEKPQTITEFTTNRVMLYNQFPGAISKLQNLVRLFLNSTNNISSFPQDFYASQIKFLTMNFIGTALNNGIPPWVLNSPIVTLALSSSIDLSGSPVTKRVSQINMLKHTLTELQIASSQIDYTLPDELGELYKMTYLELDNNTSLALRLPNNLEGLIALNQIGLNRTRMPIAEYERVIQAIPSLRTVSMKNLTITADHTFSATNNYITTIAIGSSTWGGSIPSFINQLTALQRLDLTQVSGNLQNGGISSWGNFSNCVQLHTINGSRLTTLPVTFPAWFSSLVKLKTYLAPAAYTTATRVQQFVDNFYSFIVANAPITGTSVNAFRSMTIDIYGSSSIDTTNSLRPLGTYQMPVGYVQNSNNGTPASQMEKIWVLVNQYNHTWIVKPA